MTALLSRAAAGVSLTALALLTLTARTSAQVANGSFESDFTGWNTVGSAVITDTSFGDSPTNGVKQALLTNDATAGPYGAGSVDAGTLESALTIAPGALSGLGNGTAVNGSGIDQTFTVAATETLTFDFDFLTTEDPSNPPFNPDFAFVSLTDQTNSALSSVTRLAQVSDAATPEPPPSGLTAPSIDDFLTETGYQTYTTTLVPGTYTLGLGVVNANTSDVASSLLVDNVQTSSTTQPVPESGTALSFALLLALGGIVLVRRANAGKAVSGKQS